MRKRITPAMIVALIALFAALAGTATAAGTAALITSKQIKDGSIQLADISPKTKKALKGERGPRGYTGYTGLTGAQGPQGVQGPAGGFDPAKISYVTGPTYSFQPGDIGFAEAECPAGTKVIGGGYFANIMHVAGDRTYGDGRTWSVLINNDTSIPVDANATAVCVAP